MTRSPPHPCRGLHEPITVFVFLSSAVLLPLGSPVSRGDCSLPCSPPPAPNGTRPQRGDSARGLCSWWVGLLGGETPDRGGWGSCGSPVSPEHAALRGRDEAAMTFPLTHSPSRQAPPRLWKPETPAIPALGTWRVASVFRPWKRRPWAGRPSSLLQDGREPPCRPRPGQSSPEL